MAEDRKYDLSMVQLEREARVPIEDQVEEVATSAPDPADPRGGQPDRDWFASGG